MRTDVDLRIADLAAHQHGVFSRAQALAHGASDSFVARRVHGGRWGRLWPGVYRLAGTTPGWDQTLTAAWLAAGEGAVVAGRAAGTVWDMPKVARRLEVAVPPHGPSRLRGVALIRTALDAVDLVERGPILVTSPALTLVQLAGRVPEAALGDVVDHCFSRRLTSPAEVTARLDAIGRKGRRGVAALQRILAARPSGLHRPHEELERRLAALLAASDIEPPVHQFVVDLPSGRRVLDVAWPDALFALEADSYRHHSSLRDWARDHARNGELVAAGWRILPVTWPDVVDAAGALLDRVRRGLCNSSRNPTAVAPTSGRGAA